MGFWDVLLFCIATVLGRAGLPLRRGMANPQSLCGFWRLFSFSYPPRLSLSNFPRVFRKKRLYVWTKEAFGDFHGFVAGWTYWIYTVFYFPASCWPVAR